MFWTSIRENSQISVSDTRSQLEMFRASIWKNSQISYHSWVILFLIKILTINQRLLDLKLFAFKIFYFHTFDFLILLLFKRASGSKTYQFIWVKIDFLKKKKKLKIKNQKNRKIYKAGKLLKENFILQVKREK